MRRDLVDRWDGNVTARDVGLLRHDGATDCIGCRQPLGAAHRHHTGKCWRFEKRKDGRMGIIVWCHVKGRHELTSPDDAAWILEERDALIAEMQATGDWDRARFLAHRDRMAPDIDDAIRHRHRYLDLDLGWSGKGLPPSTIAAICDIVAQLP